MMTEVKSYGPETRWEIDGVPVYEFSMTPGPPDDASFDNFDDFVLADDKDALEKLVRDQVKSMRDEADILEELTNSIRDCTEFVLVGEEDDEEGDEEDEDEDEEYDEEDEDEEEEEDEEE